MFLVKALQSRMTYSILKVNYQQCRSVYLTHCINTSKSHYQTLGLNSQATQSEIKRAFYKLSIQFHPDKSKGNEERFKDIATAYEVLGNPRLRRLYDRGIISHDESDASINHPAGHDGAVEVDPEHSESSRASVSTFDKWSRTHTSEAFSRSQDEKRKRAAYARNMKRGSQQTASEGIVWIVGFVAIIIALVNQPWKKQSKKP